MIDDEYLKLFNEVDVVREFLINTIREIHKLNWERVNYPLEYIPLTKEKEDKIADRVIEKMKNQEKSD